MSLLMKNTKVRAWLLATGIAVVMASVFWFGFAMGTRYNLRQFATGLDDTQVMLAFNRLLDERNVESLLARGCTTAALEKTRISIDQDLKVLATFSNENRLSPGITKYIDARDPTLLNTLGNFQSKYGNSWIEPECPKR